MSECRSCGAVIRWVFTAMGGKMPLDVEPNPEGNIVLRGHTAHVVRNDDDVPKGEPRYTSHFATCPFADRHRKGRPAGSVRRGSEAR